MSATQEVASILMAFLLLGVTLPAFGQEAAPIPRGVSGIKAMSVNLTGEAAQATLGASGDALVVFNPNRGTVCYRLNLSEMSPPTAAHIHEGAEGASGGPVLNFDLPSNGLRGCVSDVDRQLLSRILREPSGFYVNVHNEDHPGGVVRGQLAD